jgi:hypothetical protein
VRGYPMAWRWAWLCDVAHVVRSSMVRSSVTRAGRACTPGRSATQLAGGGRSRPEPAIALESLPAYSRQAARSDHQVGTLLVPGEATLREANRPRPRIHCPPGWPEHRLAGPRAG